MAQRGRKPAAWADQMNGQMSLEQAWKTYDRAMIAAQRSDNTRKAYRLYVARFIEFLKAQGLSEPGVTALCPEQVRDFVVWLMEAPPSITNGSVRVKGQNALRAHVLALKALAHFLTRSRVFKTHPLAGLENPSIRKVDVQPFTHDEVKLMAAAIGDGPYATRNRAIFYFMLASGVRAAELCSLRLQRLDLKNRTASVVGKGNKERLVVFDRATAKYLGYWLAERAVIATGRDSVFVSNEGMPLSTNALYSIIRGIGDRAGVEHAHPHRCRHTMATAFLEAYPGQVFQLQTLLGHEQLEMSRRYAKSADARAILTGPSIADVLGLR